ncbi:hypothetical protein [Vibrio kanaloae]|uniref:hypothetical protein n=1 Tax=Vibrio kanaloae TaxID=170673 RepID=UPI0012448A52|nr:hypothetical protein [Vibrio kanaloae]KAB0462987.1 hypothetical protein F7Q89_13880 [Vibrio kanaloae]
MKPPIPLPNNANHQSYSRDELQHRLQSIGCKSSLHDNQWIFPKTTLDFSGLQALDKQDPEWCDSVGITPSWLARLLFLDAAKANRSIESLRNDFLCICKWLFWLVEYYRHQAHFAKKQTTINKQASLLITKTELTKMFQFQLMHSISPNGTLEARLTPSSYASTTRIDIREWQLTLRQLGLKDIGFTNAFSANVLKKTWKETFDTMFDGELTYADWKKGGTLNHLTLDYGRYYIEHCYTFFSQHISLATALKLTLEDMESIASLANVCLETATLTVHHFLQNRSIYEIPRGITHKSESRRHFSDETLTRIQTATKDVFAKHFRPLKAKETLLSASEIQALAKHFKIDVTDENEFDWLRQIITIYLPYLDNKHNSCPDKLKLLHKKWLSEVVAPRLGSKDNLDHLQAWIKARWRKHNEEVDVELPSIEWFSDLGLVIKEAHKSTFLNKFIQQVGDAGLTYVVALTGWRESEFGWSLQDIQTTRNLDGLDQHTCPWRHTVKWRVPKVSGEAKINREISQGTYDAVQQLALLVGANNHKPCLYSTRFKLIKSPKLSGEFIKNRVKSMWCHFVDHYNPFVQLDKSEAFDKLYARTKQQILTVEEQLQFQRLGEERAQENWYHLQQDRLLVEARRRARKERDRVVFFLNYSDRKKILERYCNGELPKEVHQLINAHLSETTKKDIHTKAQTSNFSARYNKEVVNEIIDGCLYPTSHALRHMWAEAVYRRFDGDAGWMIRSQFKHISQNMWLAYIRDKDNRRQHDTVKRRVISSLLQNHLRRSGKGFAGKLDTILRRVFAKTHVTSPNHLDRSIVQFAQEEIQDIKANPWGFCILLKRNQHRAKCAVDGIPQRQNACPGLCLGCSNNLIQEGNIQGILLGIANDVKVLETPGVPTAWREPAMMTVRNALKQLQRLKVAPTIMDTLQSALNTKEDAL